MNNLIDLNLSTIRSNDADNRCGPLKRSVKIKHIHSARTHAITATLIVAGFVFVPASVADHHGMKGHC
jgi:hypothetical protein